MKLFKKSTISLALTAALIGGASMSSQLSAATVNTGNDKTGDVLLFPYYTTENGFQTQVSIVNSSNTDTTIAKLRLRDAKNSNDVLDITVVLSPNDVFAGTIRDGAAGITFTRSGDDTTCTSPIAGADRNFVAGGLTPNPNGATGHVEVLTMATIPDDIDPVTYPHLASVVANSTHLTTTGDTPTTVGTGCGIVDDYFDLQQGGAAQREISDLQGELTAYNASAHGDGDDIRSNLFGAYSVFKADGGVAAAGRPTTIARAYSNDQGQAANLVSPCDETGAANTSMICGQVADKGHFTFPHLGHVSGVDAVTGGAGVTAANITAFNAFQGVIAASGMAVEWSRNTGNNVQTETIYTMPVKYVVRDDYPARTSASTADWNNLIRTTSKNVFADADYVAPESKWDHVDLALALDNVENTLYIDAGSQAGCMSFGRTTYDREEQTFTPQGGGTSVSGGQEAAQTELKLCDEVTVFTYGDGQGVTTSNAPGTAQVLPTLNLSQNFGWMRVFAKDATNNRGVNLPLIGYTMSSRELAGDANGNFAQIINNIKL